jgi:hypothetical protein
MRCGRAANRVVVGVHLALGTVFSGLRATAWGMENGGIAVGSYAAMVRRTCYLLHYGWSRFVLCGVERSLAAEELAFNEGVARVGSSTSLQATKWHCVVICATSHAAEVRCDIYTFAGATYGRQ